MPPVTPGESQRAARRVEVQELLRDQEITLHRWCGVALEQSEIKDIHVNKYTDPFLSRSTRIPFNVSRGADTEHVEALITEKYGNGTYLFSAVGSDGRYWARKAVSLGTPPEPTPIATSGAAAPLPPPSPEITLEESMKTALLRQQTRAFMAAEDTAEVTRTMAPMKMLTEMLALLRPTPDGASEKLLTHVMQENAETKRLLLELLVKGGPGHQEKDPVSSSIETLDRVMAIAGRLGMTRADTSGGGMWTAENISTIIATAAPLLKDGLDTVKLALHRGARVAGSVVDGTAEVIHTGAQAVAQATAPTGAEARSMTQSLSVVDKELVEIGYAALQTKDFQTVEMAYNAIRPLTGGFLPELNPDVNPALYINLMRRFDARFDLVRLEWAAFLGWLKEQETLAGGTEPDGDTAPE